MLAGRLPFLGLELLVGLGAAALMLTAGLGFALLEHAARLGVGAGLGAVDVRALGFHLVAEQFERTFLLAVGLSDFDLGRRVHKLGLGVELSDGLAGADVHNLGAVRQVGDLQLGRRVGLLGLGDRLGNRQARVARLLGRRRTLLGGAEELLRVIK